MRSCCRAGCAPGFLDAAVSLQRLLCPRGAGLHFLPRRLAGLTQAPVALMLPRPDCVGLRPWRTHILPLSALIQYLVNLDSL